ncbi:MAG: alpha-ketoacid dehydrogenase subunit beta, partial [Cellulomonas sp.]|nr:alpha-ketoacid dehydrogenase subunit beta [Cellulomonas sp.]
MTMTSERAVQAPAGVQRLPMAKAINAGLRRALSEDDHVMLMGEDIGRLGGVFRVTDGLHADFGDSRVV